jgi:hypothetical protein
MNVALMSLKIGLSLGQAMEEEPKKPVKTVILKGIVTKSEFEMRCSNGDSYSG